MPRPPRADEAGGLYHALNRGNLRADIFKKEGDFVAFGKILFEGLQLYQVDLFSYQQRYKSFPIQNDEHFFVVCRYVEGNALRAGLVKRAEDWRWGSLWRWLQKTEPYPRLLSAWPLPRLPNWVERVNEPLTKHELDAVRLSAQRGRPLGDDGWVESIARRLKLESTMRPRGRQRVRPVPVNANKEA